MGRSRRARAPQTQPADSLPGSRSTNVLLEIESEQTSLAIGLCRLVGDLDLAELPVIRKRAGQQPQVSPCEKTAISDALLQSFCRPSHYPPSFRNLWTKLAAPWRVGVARSSSKKEPSLQGLCASMFSSMTTRTEREQILERVRSLDRVVDGEPLTRAAANAAVSVAQPRRSPQPLPC